MEKQRKAERERRARILDAEGEKRSQILVAEGLKESAILKAASQPASPAPIIITLGILFRNFLRFLSCWTFSIHAVFASSESG